MAGTECILNTLYENHDVQDKGERHFIRRALEAGLLTEKNCAGLLAAHREGSQLTYDALVDADTGFPSSPQRAPVIRAGHASPSAQARAEVLSRYLARHATNDLGVRMFRRSLLGNPTAVLQPAQANLLVQLPAVRVLNWKELRSAYGAHPNQWIANARIEPPLRIPQAHMIRVPIRLGQAQYVQVKPQSFLDGLNAHAETLDDELGSSQPDASWFLLTGEVPILRSLTSATRGYVGLQGVPTIPWITIKALPHVSAESVGAVFAKEQRLLLGRRKGREIGPRNLALLDFVLESVATRRAKPDFPRLLKAWNRRQRREWRYTYPSKMERDYKASAVRVFLLGVRLEHAPGPGDLNVLEHHLTERTKAPSFFLEDG